VRCGIEKQRVVADLPQQKEGAKFCEECAAPPQEEKRALAGKYFECSLSGGARFWPFSIRP
jgi:hypothetical protein